jgi:putative peptidoglycan lipid II flippase
MATVAVNITSIVILFWLLDRKLNGLPWREWSLPILGLTGSSFVAGVVSWATLWGCQQILGNEGLLVQLLQLCLSGLLGIGVFALITAQMRLPEVDIFVSRLRQRFIK